MPTTIVRQSFTVDEAFDIKKPKEEEVKAKKTPNLYDMTDPNWEKPVEEFEQGNYNSIHQAGELPLSKMIDMMGRHTELLLSVLNKVLEIFTLNFNKKDKEK